MPPPLPRALRLRAVAAVELEGATIEGTARRFRIGMSTLKHLLALKRETGDVEPRPRRNGPVSKRTPERMEVLGDLVAAQPDLYLYEFAEAWSASVGIRMTRSDVIRGLAELGLTLKKKRSAPVNGTRSASPSSGRRTKPGAPK